MMYTAGAFQVPFPFQPYPLQLHAMSAIRSGLEAGEVVVLESPTGTGKTQTLLNGVLSHVFEPVITESHDDTRQQPQPASLEVPARDKSERAGRACGKRRSERVRNARMVGSRGGGGSADPSVAEDIFLLEQHSYEDAHGGHLLMQAMSTSSSSSSSSISSPTMKTESGALYAFNGDDDDDDDDSNICTLRKPKVYFSSRTHTQLQQILEELSHTVFAQHQVRSRRRPRCCSSSHPHGAVGEEEQHQQQGHAKDYSDELPHKLRYIHVAGRQQLCLNAAIRAAAGGNNERLNELCLEAMSYEYSKEGLAARKQREGVNGGLPVADMEDGFHLPDGKRGCGFCRRERLKILYDYVDIAPRGLSEMRKLGQQVGACPFLATRKLLRGADVVLIPYSYLVSGEMRDALLSGTATNEHSTSAVAMKRYAGEKDGHSGRGYSARRCSRMVAKSAPLLSPDFSGDIVVVDEAHNLVDYCRSVTTTSVTEAELSLVRTLLDGYRTRFDGRLLTRNKQRIREIVAFVEKLTQYIRVAGEKTAPGAEVQSLSSFVFDAGVDAVNVYCFIRFLEETRLLPKLHGLVVHLASRLKEEGMQEQQQQQRQRQRLKERDDDTMPRMVCGGVQGGPLSQSIDSMNAVLLPLLRDHQAVTTALHRFENFLRWYGRSDDNTRVVLRRLPLEAGSEVLGTVTLELVQLEPGMHTLFPVLQQAQAAVLAGGTMKPTALTCDLLLRRPTRRALDIALEKDKKSHNGSNVGNENNVEDGKKGIERNGEASPPAEKAVRFVEEGHVVPFSSVAVFALGVGPSGRRVEFQHSTRTQWQSQFEDVAAALLNFSHVVPAGMIVFFTSYEMEELFVGHLQRSGMYDTINDIKRIFREPSRAAASAALASSPSAAEGARSSTPVEAMLDEYAAWIRTGESGGALLLAVMGGKLSEGINFNDDLGRAVMVVGLPYANPSDVELQLHLNHVARTRLVPQSPFPAASSSSSSSSSLSAPAGLKPSVANDTAPLFYSPLEWDLFTDLCMRAVNQSIGRCIRHAGDYAVVILLDARYVGRAGVRRRIATWMQPSLRVVHNFGECFRGVREFFGVRRQEAVPRSV